MDTTFGRLLTTILIIGFLSLRELESTYVNPSTFLDSRLAKGTWISKQDTIHTTHIFEGGWIWTPSGELQVTHVCRAKSTPLTFSGIGPIEPGELVNETCYVSG